MSETAMLETPAQAVEEPTHVTAPAAVESVTPAPAAQGDTVTEAQALEAIFEARSTGNNKEADRLTALLEAAKKAPAQAEPAAVQPVPAVDPVAEAVDPEAATEPPTPAADATDLPEPNRLRITHLSEADKSDQIAIHALTKKGIPLAEAVQRIMGPLTVPQPAATPEPAAEVTPPEITNPSIAEHEAVVAALERQIDELADNGGFQGTEGARLTKELSRANAKLEAARVTAANAERESARENTAFEAQREANEDAAIKQYPALSDTKSPLYQLWYDLSLAAHNPAHPEHAKSQSVDGPAYFAAKAAKILGAQPVAKPVVPAPPATQPPPATRPAAGTKGSAPPPPAKTAGDLAREAEAAFESATTGRLETARRQIGGIITR